jgi:hypothetical protein
MGAEVDYQVAAPAENDYAQLVPSDNRSTNEFGWKDGDRGGLAQRQTSYLSCQGSGYVIDHFRKGRRMAFRSQYCKCAAVNGSQGRILIELPLGHRTGSEPNDGGASRFDPER